MEALVSTDWLAAELGAGDLRILDATLFLPGSDRDAEMEFRDAHLPGALFLDLDRLVDPDSALPHTLPPPGRIGEALGSLGVSSDDRILVYDNSPLHSAARAWWMLCNAGARSVAILDGGLQKWKAEGRPLESGTTGAAPRAATFRAAARPEAGIDKDGVSALVHSPMHEIVDARPASRFLGQDPEPRPGVEPGHIPGSRNLPQSDLFEPDNRWKRGEALRAEFEAAGVDLTKPMVTTCGSGVTAAVLLFGAHLLGKEDVRLYDGSWSEWGSDPALPKARG